MEARLVMGKIGIKNPTKEKRDGWGFDAPI